MPTTRGDVVIGLDVWLGTEALILSGVKIGHGAIVAARAVVPREIPPYSVAAGVPVRVVRKRFSEDQIQRLLDIAWWDWPDEQIQEPVPWFASNRIDEFLARFGTL